MGFKLAVDEEGKATELRLWYLRGTAAQNPHMRAFWAATISCFVALLGWFALAPLGLDVASSIGICENQLYPPTDFPTMPAYLMFENLRTQQRYCRFGRNAASEPSDCNPSPDGEDIDRYDPSVLSKCVCTPGTRCAGVLSDAGLASVASTIFARMFLGTFLERWGPVNVQASLMAFGAMWVAASAGINAEWNFVLVRFFVGAAGATFVTNSFWCALMFAPKILGRASGTASGWGSASGGLTDVFMLIALFQPLKASGLPADYAWRVAVLIPAGMMLLCAVGIKCLCWDTPTRKRFSAADLGKQGGPSAMDYIRVLKDYRVVLLIMQYSGSCGPELIMFNKLSTHFRTYFQMAAGDAASLASAFGCMSLFARSLGGMLSDAMFVRFGLRGRLWAMCLTLILEAIFFFAFGLVDNTQSWTVALVVIVIFAVFCQMAGAATVAIVPFTQTQNLAIISALVAAGGNMGAVVSGFAFYRPISDPLLPFQLHAACVFGLALLTPIYYWPEHGGMFRRPSRAVSKKKTVDIEAQMSGAAPKIEVKVSETDLTTDADAASAESEPTTDVELPTSDFENEDSVVPLMSDLQPTIKMQRSRLSNFSEDRVGRRPSDIESAPDVDLEVPEDEDEAGVVPLMSEMEPGLEVERALSEVSRRRSGREVERQLSEVKVMRRHTVHE